MNERNAHTLSICRRFVVAAIAGAIAQGYAMVSTAGESRDVRQITVRFADLNISSPEGAAALYARIRSAANTVCSPEAYASFPFHTPVDACVHKATVDAVMKVNQAALYAVYNEHNKPPLPATLLSQRH